QMQLFRRNPLQTAEQRVRRRVASRESHTEPSEKTCEEWIHETGASECETENRVDARVTGDVAQAEHRHNCENRHLHAMAGFLEAFKKAGKRESGEQRGESGSNHDSRAGGGEPVERIYRV